MPTRISTKLKGTNYYSGETLYKSGEIKKGSSLQLIHEADNEYDQNAVAVHHLASSKKIGHISKELAPKYCELLRTNRIIDATVKAVTRVGSYFDIVISVRYLAENEVSATQVQSRFSRSIEQLSNVSGVYAIKNVQNERQYVGSSVRVRERLKSHLSALIFKIRPNAPLSADFKSIGANGFEAHLLERATGEHQLLSAEEQWISNLTSKGITLYNRTLDGKGVAPGSKLYSDWLNPTGKGVTRKASRLVEFREFGSVSLSDLKRIRSALVRYLEKLQESAAANKLIEEENERISRRNAQVKNAAEQYGQQYIRPLEQQLSQLYSQIEEHKVGTVAGLWTDTIDFRPSHYGKVWQTIRIKDMPLTRQLIERHSQIATAYKRAESGRPSSTVEQTKPLSPRPKDRSTITISGKKHYLDFEKLDLADIDRLIKGMSSDR